MLSLFKCKAEFTISRDMHITPLAAPGKVSVRLFSEHSINID